MRYIAIYIINVTFVIGKKAISFIH